MKNIVTHLRERDGLSKKALADALEVSENTIFSWENGSEIRFKNIVALSKYFQVSVDDILGVRH